MIDQKIASNNPRLNLEKQSLVDFFLTTNGANWIHKENWCTDEPISTWFGVQIDEQGSVHALTLDGNNLHGEIPTSISNLSNVAVLILSNNSLYGELPSSMRSLIHLSGLILSYNQLTGSIPYWIGEYSELSILDLSNNQFFNSIPEPICNLTRLTKLFLHNNQVSDQIPANIGNLISLTELYLQCNMLEGPVPDSVGNLVELKDLDLFNNNLSGSIPYSIGKLRKLTELDFSNNQLTGEIPLSFGNLRNLTELYLRKNQLSGVIPSCIGNLENLIVLDLSNNHFSSPIPESIGTLTKLTELDLSNNSLSGEVPENISELNCLLGLFLRCNKLSGPVPVGIGSLTSLESLLLEHNEFVSIPESIGSLSKLKNFKVHNNQLSEFPSAIVNLKNLETFSFHANRIKYADEIVPLPVQEQLRFLGIPTGSNTTALKSLLLECVEKQLLWTFLCISSSRNVNPFRVSHGEKSLFCEAAISNPSLVTTWIEGLQSAPSDSSMYMQELSISNIFYREQMLGAVKEAFKYPLGLDICVRCSEERVVPRFWLDKISHYNQSLVRQESFHSVVIPLIKKKIITENYGIMRVFDGLIAILIKFISKVQVWVLSSLPKLYQSFVDVWATRVNVSQATASTFVVNGPLMLCQCAIEVCKFTCILISRAATPKFLMNGLLNLSHSVSNVWEFSRVYISSAVSTIVENGPVKLYQFTANAWDSRERTLHYTRSWLLQVYDSIADLVNREHIKRSVYEVVSEISNNLFIQFDLAFGTAYLWVNNFINSASNLLFDKLMKCCGFDFKFDFSMAPVDLSFYSFSNSSSCLISPVPITINDLQANSIIADCSLNENAPFTHSPQQSEASSVALSSSPSNENLSSTPSQSVSVVLSVTSDQVDYGNVISISLADSNSSVRASSGYRSGSNSDDLVDFTRTSRTNTTTSTSSNNSDSTELGGHRTSDTRVAASNDEFSSTLSVSYSAHNADTNISSLINPAATITTVIDDYITVTSMIRTASTLLVGDSVSDAAAASESTAINVNENLTSKPTMPDHNQDYTEYRCDFYSEFQFLNEPSQLPIPSSNSTLLPFAYSTQDTTAVTRDIETGDKEDFLVEKVGIQGSPLEHSITANDASTSQYSANARDSDHSDLQMTWTYHSSPVIDLVQVSSFTLPTNFLSNIKFLEVVDFLSEVKNSDKLYHNEVVQVAVWSLWERKGWRMQLIFCIVYLFLLSSLLYSDFCSLQFYRIHGIYAPVSLSTFEVIATVIFLGLEGLSFYRSSKKYIKYNDRHNGVIGLLFMMISYIIDSTEQTVIYVDIKSLNYITQYSHPHQHSYLAKYSSLVSDIRSVGFVLLIINLLTYLHLFQLPVSTIPIHSKFKQFITPVGDIVKKGSPYLFMIALLLFSLVLEYSIYYIAIENALTRESEQHSKSIPSWNITSSNFIVVMLIIVVQLLLLFLLFVSSQAYGRFSNNSTSVTIDYHAERAKRLTEIMIEQNFRSTFLRRLCERLNLYFQHWQLQIQFPIYCVDDNEDMWVHYLKHVPAPSHDSTQICKPEASELSSVSVMNDTEDEKSGDAILHDLKKRVEDLSVEIVDIYSGLEASVTELKKDVTQLDEKWYTLGLQIDSKLTELKVILDNTPTPPNK